MSTAETAALPLDEHEIARKLLPILRVGVDALKDSGWRPGMSADALVSPIVLAVVVALGERLPLAELKAARDARCRSCDHLTALHHQDGCAYTVSHAAEGRAPGCPCIERP